MTTAASIGKAITELYDKRHLLDSAVQIPGRSCSQKHSKCAGAGMAHLTFCLLRCAVHLETNKPEHTVWVVADTEQLAVKGKLVLEDCAI